MIRNNKKYSIEVNKIGQDISISISLEMELSPDLAELVLRDLSTDIKDFNEARILAEIVRDPIIIYSLCQQIEEVKNQEVRYPELRSDMRHQDNRREAPDWNLELDSTS
ncbi:hypothetical protein ACE1CI_28300 [Aerosakkonemataceae cyanobacterium BLCC-F50]|uniref:Uncharacterized protein n=1 Tax=Floridaenema flaviceps BLCC-F50 TaxID=3153642 RepID=A0ABV4XZE1_9CYAN